MFILLFQLMMLLQQETKIPPSSKQHLLQKFI